MSMQPGMANSTSLERLLGKARTRLLELHVVAVISITGCAGQNASQPALDRAAVATETVAVAGVETRATATPTTAPPPPVKPDAPTRPATSSLNPPADPAGLEPTATPTATPPTPSPTPTPIPTSSIIPGWLTYENKFLGYSFSYPPEGTIGHHGTTEIPPENVTTRREYLAWEETVTPNNLCVGVSYKTGFVTVGPMDETLSLYASPCGITGIGDYTIENWEEDITIDGRAYTAGGYKLYIWETDQLVSEFYILLDVNDNLRIDFGVDKMGASQSGQPEVSEQEFNEIRETLLQILASFRFFAPQASGG